MKLFIDTSNKKIVLAIIDWDNKIIDFLSRNTHNNVVENGLSIINTFLSKNKLKLIDFEEFMITVGPGSFTGVKVPLNILRTVNLVKKIEKIYTISTFKLLEEKNKKYVAIPFGKNKFFLKHHNRKKIKIVNNLDKMDEKNIAFGYETFNKTKLKQKIDSESFKLLDNIDKVKLKYLTIF